MARCGVLALQGDFAAHAGVLERLGARVVPVRSRRDLADVDGLVLPGGESTAMLRLMAAEDLVVAIAEAVGRGVAVLGTCAGVILLATKVVPAQQTLRLLDIEVLRNAYGRQVASTVAPVRLRPALGSPPELPGVFIRAPRIQIVGPEVEVLGTRDGEPVLVRRGRVIGATFHPELGLDDRVHHLFVSAMEADHD